MRGDQDKKTTTLRTRAEDLLKGAGKSTPRIREQDTAEVIHELDVHRVELEMQNEELRRSQVEVEESQRKYAELYEFAPIGFCSMDRKGQIQQINLAGAQILGTEKRYLTQRQFRSFVGPGFRDEFDQFFHKLFQPGRREICELRLARNNGVLVDVELVGSALADPSLGIIRESQVAILDITGRKKAEGWFRTLVETTQDAVISIDRQGRIVLFNASAERIFGYRGNEIAGQKVNVLMPEPYTSQHDEYITRYERTGEAHAIGQIRTVTARRKDGRRFPVELSITEIPDENAPYAAFIRDISDKTRLQEELVESERLAAIVATAAIMGHEIANPLNSMHMTVQLLEKQLAQQETPMDEQIAADLKVLTSETARLTKLLQQFRIMSRKEQYDFCPTNIAELITDVDESYRPVWGYRKIEVEHVLEPTLPSVIVDRDKITQVLLNLYKNSVEAMPRGGKITVKASATEAGVVLEITDTGTGIPQNIDIFEPFATTKIGGTGIGLMVVRQIVMAHGGTITYQSEPDKGTSFFITLPVNKI